MLTSFYAIYLVPVLEKSWSSTFGIQRRAGDPSL